MKGRIKMGFEKIDKKETNTPEGRECILTYGFTGKEFQKIKKYSAMVGVRDIIEIQQDMLGIKIKDILEDHLIKEAGLEGPEERLIIFNAFSGKKLNAFIGNFKNLGMLQPLLATVTPTSIEWRFRDLITELQREREAIAKNNETPHQDK